MNNFRSFLMLPPNLLDQWRNVLGLGSSAGSANQKLRRKAARKVLIEHRAHSGWQLEAGEKIFVNAPAPNDVQRLIANFDLADGRESQRCAFRQFLLPEKWLFWGGCWQCAFFVTELSRPLRGRDDRALGIHELKKIQPLALSQRFRFIQISAVVGSASIDGQRNAGCVIATRDSFDTLGYFFSAAIKLMVKLCDQGSRALFVRSFKCSTRGDGNNPRHRCNRHEYCQAKNSQQFAAEAHGFSVASHASCTCQLPSRPVVQFFTVEAAAVVIFKCKSGMMRLDSSREVSAAYRSEEASLVSFGCGSLKFSASFVNASAASNDASGILTSRKSVGPPFVSCTDNPASRAFNVILSAMTRANLSV